MTRLAAWCCVVLAGLAAGCRPVRGPDEARERSSPTPPAATPAAAVATFDGPGVTLTYAADAWTPTPSDDYVLKLVSREAPDRVLSLDVPRLPPHIPGLIPLGLVVNGYVDDLKTQHPGVEVDEPVATKVAGANARRVRAVWQQGGESFLEEAVLTVHGDRVYIFRANSPASQDAEAYAALERLVDSIVWD